MRFLLAQLVVALAAIYGPPLIEDDQIFYLDTETGKITRDPPPAAMLPMAIPDDSTAKPISELDLMTHLVEKQVQFTEELVEGIYEVEIIMVMPVVEPFGEY